MFTKNLNKNEKERWFQSFQSLHDKREPHALNNCFEGYKKMSVNQSKNSKLQNKLFFDIDQIQKNE